MLLRKKGCSLSHLEMESVFPTCLDSYPIIVLSAIKHFDAHHFGTRDGITEQTSLLQVLPLMKNLTSLVLTVPSPQIVGLFHAISRSNVTQLKLKECNQTCLS